MTNWALDVEGTYESINHLQDRVVEVRRDHRGEIPAEMGPIELLDLLNERGQIHKLPDGQYEVRLANSQRRKFGEGAQYFALLEGQEGEYQVVHAGEDLLDVRDHLTTLDPEVSERFLVGLFPASSVEQLEGRVNGLLGKNPQRTVDMDKGDLGQYF